MTLYDTSSNISSSAPSQSGGALDRAPLRIGLADVVQDASDATELSALAAPLRAALETLGHEVITLRTARHRYQAVHDGWRALLAASTPKTARNEKRRVPYERTWRTPALLVAAQQRDLEHLIHFNQATLPGSDVDDGLRHYLYCSHTCNLARRYHAGATARARQRRREDRERQAFLAADHIFTCGRYVRDNLVEHYGVPLEQVTAVGSGIGPIRPYIGRKDYGQRPTLLFVATQISIEKGGQLALQAFRLARRRRPDLRLVVAGNDRWKSQVGREPGVLALGEVPEDMLEQLMHAATLLLQPMLNDPWGQIYLNALASRTPIIGLQRNGLPEIVDHGRYGFLVPEPDPMVLAETLADALAEPEQLAEMGESGQRWVMSRYSWDRIARTITETIGAA